MSKIRVGFIGVGLMGLPMVKNIAKNNYPLSIWNRSQKNLKKIKNNKINICKNLIDIPSQSQVIIMMLSNDKVCLDIAKELSKKDGQFVLKGDMKIKDIVKNEEILFNFEDGAFSGRCVIYSNDYNIHAQKTREKSKILIKITVPVL